ncbi:MAG: phytanoyl-CoA dioxygenase family protein [Leptospiraceae bacterium]|nr:phytanoyl-CoA dioxygenase family protein [Leptospiraceae bacterium]
MEYKSKLKYSLKYFNRFKSLSFLKDDSIYHKVSLLKNNGYLILENFINEELLQSAQKKYKDAIESKHLFETPCLSQAKIDGNAHKQLIDNYFRYKPNQLVEYGVTFEKSDFSNYKECLDNFKPSTLKTYLSDIQDFYILWLNETLLNIIEGYMGLRPHLVEAYLRRNFPAKYKVMNHFWHRDTNHPEFLVKAFIFLSDCKVTNGPHEYVSGSISDRSLDGKPYYSDEDVDRLYPEGSPQRIQSIVKAGTVILEDTRGLHRATIPQEGFRDLGFAVFMPLSRFSKPLEPLYRVDKETYSSLTSYQKSFIPKQNIQ